MKFEYSKTDDALYVYFQEVEVSRSEEADEGVVIDYDALGGVVGIEVLDASERVGEGDYEGVGWLVHRLLANDSERERSSAGPARRRLRSPIRARGASHKKRARTRVKQTLTRRRAQKRVRRESRSPRLSKGRVAVA